jgi:cell division protein FtsI/penicillin-binding protein 2
MAFLRNRFIRRVIFLMAFLVLGLAASVYRIVTIQGHEQNSDLVNETNILTKRWNPADNRRGTIYDRNGNILALNELYYEVMMDPYAIQSPTDVALVLAPIADSLTEAQILAEAQQRVDANNNPRHYVPIAALATKEEGEHILALQSAYYQWSISPDRKNVEPPPYLYGVIVRPRWARHYPNGTVAAHILGRVNLQNEGTYGIEGRYNGLLNPNLAQDNSTNALPYDVQLETSTPSGEDLYLTMDLDVQFASEQLLAEAISEYGAESGSMIVLDPRTGEIWAMANQPTYDPNNTVIPEDNPNTPENEKDDALYWLTNRTISHAYEPGSTFKVLTAAAGLDSGKFTPEWSYYDDGVFEYGGVPIYNWDRGAWGQQDYTGWLQHSLNTGAARVAAGLGPTQFFSYINAFGFANITNVDLQGEMSGWFPEPGNALYTDSTLATISFGQGIAVTPLQLAVAVSSVANQGTMMQPRLVLQHGFPGELRTIEPTRLGEPIRPETAQALSQILKNSLENEASNALVEGYSIAGKTGTAQIPVNGIYDPTKTIASFVGWFPVDQPRFLILVKLDKPSATEWGSQTAAPTFAKMVQRLVVLAHIPPDSVRLQLGQ